MIALGSDTELSGFLWDMRMCVFKCLIIGGWLGVHFCIQDHGCNFIGKGDICLFGT